MLDLPGIAGFIAAADSIELSKSIANVAYIVAAVLFILSLGGLSKQTTASRGNWMGIVGMLLAIAATIYGYMTGGLPWMILAMVPAVVIGAVLAARVPMTGMPELVALLHSFVGLAAVLVGVSTHIAHNTSDAAHAIESGTRLTPHIH